MPRQHVGDSSAARLSGLGQRPFASPLYFSVTQIHRLPGRQKQIHTAREYKHTPLQLSTRLVQTSLVYSKRHFNNQTQCSHWLLSLNVSKSEHGVMTFCLTRPFVLTDCFATCPFPLWAQSSQIGTRLVIRRSRLYSANVRPDLQAGHCYALIAGSSREGTTLCLKPHRRSTRRGMMDDSLFLRFTQVQCL